MGEAGLGLWFSIDQGFSQAAGMPRHQHSGWVLSRGWSSDEEAQGRADSILWKGPDLGKAMVQPRSNTGQTPGQTPHLPG
jgi:hypothetical protein